MSGYSIIITKNVLTSKAKNILVEIYINRLNHNGESIQKFNSLIAPVVSLTEKELKNTGINRKDLIHAPQFVDIADTIIDLTSSTTLICTDKKRYNQIKGYFKTIGFNYNLKLLTIPKSYLDRALDLPNLKQLPPPTSVNYLNQFEYTTIESIIRIYFNNSFTSEITDDSKEQVDIINQIKEVRSTPGIYKFKDDQNNIIYVGKATNLRNRIRSYFSSTTKASPELVSKIHSFEVVYCGSVLIAELTEAELIRNLKPTYNKAQKKYTPPYLILSKSDAKGILRLIVQRKDYIDLSNNYFSNRRSAITHLELLVRNFNLCMRFTSLQKEGIFCNNPSSINCSNFCKNLEHISNYNFRVRAALQSLEKDLISYIIKEKGRSTDEYAIVLIENGIYQGFGFISNHETIRSVEDLKAHISFKKNHYYTHQIIDSYLRKNPNSRFQIPSNHWP